MPAREVHLLFARFTELQHGWGGLRLGERIAVVFFTYTAALSVSYRLGPHRLLVAICAPFLLFGLVCWEAAQSRVWSRHLRNWLLPGVVLAGYWQIGWFQGKYHRGVELLWLNWDRVLLDGLGVRWWIETQAQWLAWWLELSYLLLYTVPAAALGLLYYRGEQKRIGSYLSMFTLGTLLVYALLPLVPLQSPRTAFIGLDTPGVTSIWRVINVWILDHMDISTNVFPSGHVAVAFSSALGIRRAVPEWRWGFVLFLWMAVSVFAATIYGRYHYAMDGLASIVICGLAWIGLELYEKLG